MENTLKTILLLGVLTAFLVGIGGLLGGRDGLYIAFGFALLTNGFAYFFSDKMALRASGAQPLTREQSPQVYAMVERLSQQASIPMPRLYITPDRQANAFATGRGPQHAAVAVTQGLLQALPDRQVEAVIAHELAHVKHRDILIASVAATVASAIGFLANMAMFGGLGRGDDDSDSGGGVFALVGIFLAPLAGTIIQLAISRQREFAADARAAQLIGHGQPLADALLNIHKIALQAPMQHNPAYSSLYIGNPAGGIGGGIAALFSTHPPVEERVKRLLSM
jgi:heat shock protein HtpX